jgi:Protein of unknown function (DUF2628)
MSIYTVHEPPSTDEQAAPDPERLVFVRDGFSFWAFLLTPAWMLWHGLWLVFLGYLVVAALLAVGLHAIGASTGVTLATAALLALLVGFEAATLRRLTLARRRWRNVGIVVGDDMESAERRFFDAWVHGASHASAAPAATPTFTSSRATAAGRPASEIIGLFPAPGGSR